MGKGKGKGPPGTPQQKAEWKEGMGSFAKGDEEQEKEISAMYDMFKKCGGKKEACARDKFVKKFASAVLIDGEPMVVADVESLFNASQVDYDYDNMSWDEFMKMMIVIRGTDAKKKLAFAFKLLDKDLGGTLDSTEVDVLFSTMTAAMKPDELKKFKTKLKDKFDGNGDGKWSLKELENVLDDEEWLKKTLGKGVTATSAANVILTGSVSGGPVKSSACLVM